ncbi:unnamed protein product [Coregonus sp. 'balchen']|nr:unnamed protein product [Coregonus sp. 'balchen']
MATCLEEQTECAPDQQPVPSDNDEGFRADGASNSSHFVYQMHQPSSRHPPLNFPTSPHTFILESNRASSHYGNPPHPLPRRALPKPKVRRVQAIYDCHGYVEGQPNKKGLFPSSFVHVLSY